MSAHTPGPWTAVEHEQASGERGWWSVLRGAWDISHNQAAKPGVVADCQYSAMTPEENEANARLIAAAPDLLAALERIAAWDPEAAASDKNGLSIIDAIDISRAAIAAAKGESQ